MDQVAITRYIVGALEGAKVLVASKEGGAPELAWGDSFFFYDPTEEGSTGGQFQFATIVTKDYGEFDRASQLDREGVFRLNIGLSKETYRTLFGDPPAHPALNETVGTGHDFAALDQLMPHPVYASQSWVSILNPSEEVFNERVKPLLADAYQQAVRRFGRRRA